MNKAINEIILKTKVYEDEKTLGLINESKILKNQGFLTKSLALKILKWKSPRPLKHYSQNSNEDFIMISKLAFKQKDYRLKIHILTALCGVKYPSASAILMFYDPINYPVIDIRVWRQLYECKLVNNNPRGQNFTLEQCEKYLLVLNELANQYKHTTRQIEKKIFDYDKINQIGTLY